MLFSQKLFPGPFPTEEVDLAVSSDSVADRFMEHEPSRGT